MKLRPRDPNRHTAKPTPAPPPLPPPPPPTTSNPKPAHRPRRRYHRYRNPAKPFACALCHKRYTRRHSVYDHFPRCVRKNGNPRRVRWNDDVSCWLPGQQVRDEEVELTSSTEESLGSGEGSVVSEAMLEFEDNVEVEERVLAGGVEMRSSPPRRLIPTGLFRRVAEWEPERRFELDRSEGLQPGSDVGPAVGVGTEEFREGGDRRVLHPFEVMKIGSLAILASKDHASRGVKEVKAVFELWAEMDPNVTRPTNEAFDEMNNTTKRRIAIGTFANRVLSSCLTEAAGQHDGLLALTSGLRNVAAEVGAADTVAEIHDVVCLALGDHGPLML